MGNLKFSHLRIIAHEFKRITLVENTRGLTESSLFSRQGVGQYGQALNTSKGNAYHDRIHIP